MTHPDKRRFNVSNKLQAILQTASLMPSIPKAVQEVLKLVNKEETTIDEMAEAIALDPVISAKVLRMANSAFFGRAKQVDSIEDAALLVGTESIRTMVLASGLMGSFEGSQGFDMNRFWSLSLLSAHIAKDIAKLFGHDGNRAYTAALIHGLGVLAIHKATPEVAQRIDKDCRDTCPYDRADAESLALGFHHAEVSAEIANTWNLPKEIGESIRHYPHPDYNYMRNSMASLIHLSVALAINMADELPIDDSAHNMDDSVAKLRDERLPVLQEMQPRFVQAKKMVDMLVTSH